MAYTPATGDVAKLSFGTEDLAAINWKNDIDGNAKDASNFRDGRNVATTLPNATTTFTVIWDSNDQPTATAAANLRIGATGTMKCYVDATKFFSQSVKITKISPENKGMEDLVTMDVTAMLIGTITYPVDS